MSRQKPPSTPWPMGETTTLNQQFMRSALCSILYTLYSAPYQFYGPCSTINPGHIPFVSRNHNIGFGDVENLGFQILKDNSREVETWF